MSRPNKRQTVVFRMFMLLFLSFHLLACDWDKEAQVYLDKAKKFVADYVAEALHICNQLINPQVRDLCILKVQDRHAEMSALVVAATAAHSTCDEVIFKESLEAIQDLGKAALKLGLNSFIPIAEKAPTQVSMVAVSNNGLHYALKGDSSVWTGASPENPEGYFITMNGELQIAWAQTETGYAGAIISADWTAVVMGLEFPLALNVDPEIRPSVVLLTPHPKEPGLFQGMLHLALWVDAPTLGEIPFVLKLPVQTTNPMVSLTLGIKGQTVPAGEIFPLWSQLALNKTDCDKNGVADWQQIGAGVATDCNFDGVIDTCQNPATVVCIPGLVWPQDDCGLEPCPTHSCDSDRGDFNADGITNVLDVQCGLVAVLMSLAETGSLPDCLKQYGPQLDMGCDGSFNVADLLSLVQLSLGAPLSKTQDSDQNGCPDTCEPKACDDMDPCTTDTFVSGLGCTHTPVVCDDGDGCTMNVCLGAMGCVSVDVQDCCGDGVCSDSELQTAECLQDCALALCTPTSSTPTTGYCADNGCASKPGRICKAVSDIECKCVKTTPSVCGDGVCADDELQTAECLQDCALALCTVTSSTPTLGYCDDNGCASKPGRICKAVSDIECKCVKTQSTCGDGICGTDENCANCSTDCASCPESACTAVNPTPGCDNAECQDCVCKLDSFCCETQWDSLCVNQAKDACGNVCAEGAATLTDCAKPKSTPGCNNAQCQSCVCQSDPFCCEVSWDTYCAQAATGLCKTPCSLGQ